jgi:Tol biopolymer transport system component
VKSEEGTFSRIRAVNPQWTRSTTATFAKLAGVFAFIVVLTACMSVVPPVRSTAPVWSPDGRRIAYECYEGGPRISSFEFGIAEYTEDAAEICVMDINGQNKTRLTHNDTADVSPIWSPDGRQIAFIGSDGLYVINSDGTNLRHLVENRWIKSAAWSPDGLRSAYVSSKGDCDTPANETLRLKVFDIPNRASHEVLNRDLYGLRDVSWLAADKISLAFNESAAIAWRTDLYIVNVTTGDIIEHLFGGMRDAVHYARSHDRASIAYSTSLGDIYHASSSFDHTQEIWKADDIIYSLSWSPDDQFLLVNSGYRVSGTQNPQFTEVIWLISRDGSSATRLTSP